MRRRSSVNSLSFNSIICILYFPFASSSSSSSALSPPLSNWRLSNFAMGRSSDQPQFVYRMNTLFDEWREKYESENERKKNVTKRNLLTLINYSRRCKYVIHVDDTHTHTQRRRPQQIPTILFHAFLRFSLFHFAFLLTFAMTIYDGNYDTRKKCARDKYSRYFHFESEKTDDDKAEEVDQRQSKRRKCKVNERASCELWLTRPPLVFLSLFLVFVSSRRRCCVLLFIDLVLSSLELVVGQMVVSMSDRNILSRDDFHLNIFYRFLWSFPPAYVTR